jgi:Zn finger protein HypA/HybF involved in hydrogenase expression
MRIKMEKPERLQIPCPDCYSEPLEFCDAHDPDDRQIYCKSCKKYFIEDDIFHECNNCDSGKAFVVGDVSGSINDGEDVTAYECHCNYCGSHWHDI